MSSAPQEKALHPVCVNHATSQGLDCGLNPFMTLLVWKTPGPWSEAVHTARSSCWLQDSSLSPVCELCQRQVGKIPVLSG